MAPSDGRRVYALIEAEKGGLFRSDDGGESWTLASGRPRAAAARLVLHDADRQPGQSGRGLGARTCRCSRASTAARPSSTSRDSTTATTTTCGSIPRNPRRMIARDDGGVDVSTDGGETWIGAAAADRPVLPRVRRQPRAVPRGRRPAGHRHRPGAQRTRSPAAASATPTGTAWAAARPAGWSPTPSDPNIVYAGEYLGYISRYDHRTGRVAQRQRLAGQPLGLRRRGHALPLPVDGAHRRLAARPQGRLPRRQRALPHGRRRPDLDGDQPRPDARRQVEAAVVRRPDHRRQHRASRPTARSSWSPSRRCRRADLGGQRRRPGPRHRGRRQDTGRTSPPPSPGCPSGGRSA